MDAFVGVEASSHPCPASAWVTDCGLPALVSVSILKVGSAYLSSARALSSSLFHCVSRPQASLRCSTGRFGFRKSDAGSPGAVRQFE